MVTSRQRRDRESAKKDFSRSRRARRRSPNAKTFAIEGTEVMQTHIPDGNAILARIERPYERSRLFEWLFAHHDKVISAAAGRRVEWSRLCALFAKAGLTGRGWKASQASDSAQDLAARA